MTSGKLLTAFIGGLIGGVGMQVLLWLLKKRHKPPLLIMKHDLSDEAIERIKEAINERHSGSASLYVGPMQEPKFELVPPSGWRFLYRHVFFTPDAWILGVAWSWRHWMVGVEGTGSGGSVALGPLMFVIHRIQPVGNA